MAHICIDGLNIALAHGTGIATYARNLAQVAEELGHETSTLYGRNVRGDRSEQATEAAFFGQYQAARSERRAVRAARAIRAAFLGGRRAIEIPNTGTVVRDERLDVGSRVWNSPRLFDAARVKFRLTGELLTVPNLGGVDIAHWTCPLPIRMAGARNFYTFHDIIPLRYPHLTLDDAPLYYRLLQAILRMADRVVTVSEHTKGELIEHLGVAPERIFNTSQAVDVPTESRMSHGAVRMFGVIDRSYFLTFSAIEPKKNLARLIEAYLVSGTEKPLLVAGHYTWLPPSDVLMLINLGLWDDRYSRPRSSNAIRFLGHVPRVHLDGLIRHATAVVFPSITEGFGLPIVEAMGRGTAVITSAGGATEETAGEAALLVDPFDTAALAEALQAVESDANMRQRLEAAGPARARLFDLPRYRNRIAELYAP